MLSTLIRPSCFVREGLQAYLWGLCEAWPAHSSTSGPQGWLLCHCATAREGKHSAHYCCLRKQETDSQGAILKKQLWYPFGFSCCCITTLWKVVEFSAICMLLTLYLRSSSNFSSNLRIFFLRLWIFLESCVDVSFSHSLSHDPSEELRRRLNTKYDGDIIRELEHPQFLNFNEC